jgi:hypothetical protein
MFNNIKTLLSIVAFGMMTKAATIPTLNEKECKNTYNLITKCILLVDEENGGRHACEVFESSECQQLFENADKKLSNCQFEDDMITADYIKAFVQESKSYCIKDEQGQYCPLASIIYGKDLSVYEVEDDKDDLSFMSDIYSLNCVSEICREAAFDYIDTNRNELRERYLQSDEPDESLVATMNYLESIKSSLLTEECRNGKVSAILKKEYAKPAVTSSKSNKRRKCIVRKH